LLPVAQKPLIDYVLGWLYRAGVSQATICANGSTTSLRRYLDAPGEPSLVIGYHEDRSPRGAAGCVKDAAALSTADTFVVTDGTSIPTTDLPRLLAHHRQRKADVTIVVCQRLSELGNRSHLHPTGTYVLERDVLDAVPATSFQDIKESLIPKLHREGRRIELFTVDQVSPRVLNVDSYVALNRWVIERMVAASGLEGPRTGGQSSRELIAHPTARIEDGAMIIGPVVLGPGVKVHASATILGPTSVGAGSEIRSEALVARSVVWENCIVGERALVDQCLLADDVSVEPGAVLTGMIRWKKPERPAWIRRWLATKKALPRTSAALPAASLP